MSEPIGILQWQLDEIRSALDDSGDPIKNYRPVQGLNGRQVGCCSWFDSLAFGLSKIPGKQIKFQIVKCRQLIDYIPNFLKKAVHMMKPLKVFTKILSGETLSRRFGRTKNHKYWKEWRNLNKIEYFYCFTHRELIFSQVLEHSNLQS